MSFDVTTTQGVVPPNNQNNTDGSENADEMLRRALGSTEDSDVESLGNEFLAAMQAESDKFTEKASAVNKLIEEPPEITPETLLKIQYKMNELQAQVELTTTFVSKAANAIDTLSKMS